MINLHCSSAGKSSVGGFHTIHRLGAHGEGLGGQSRCCSSLTSISKMYNFGWQHLGQILTWQLRFASGEVSEFGDSVAWTWYIPHSPEKNPLTFSAGVSFAAACVLGFFAGFFFLSLSFGPSFFGLQRRAVNVPVNTATTCLRLLPGCLPACTLYGST